MCVLLDLKGVNAKISRARECLQTLEADIVALCEHERHRRILEIKQSRPVIVSENIPEIPISYSIRIGEIAYNLRSAMDHLAWQLVFYSGGTPSDKSEFPISTRKETTKKQYREWAKDKVNGMAQEHIEVIEALQPFNKDSVVGPHLKMLHSICNIDKHRYLNVVAEHTREDIHLKEDADPNLTYPITGGQVLWDMLKGTKDEDKVEIEVITDVCFMDKDLGDASPGYGSAIESAMKSPIEREPIKRPPVAPVLWGCLTAVQFVVDTFNGGFLTGEVGEALERKSQESE